MNDRPKSPGKTQWAVRAAAWNRAAPEGASTNDGPNQLLIKWAGIAPGHTALDLASGTGEPAISIALHVGEGGSVTALDANREMLAGAERRAAHLGLANMEFVIVPMEDMAFEDDRFDAVTCRFGIMHTDDALGALRQVRRVLKPGRRAAFMVHGPAEKNNQFVVAPAALAAHLGEPEDGERMKRRFRFSGDGELTAIFASAGFSEIAEELVVKTVTHGRGVKFWEGSLARSLGARLDHMDAGERAALDGAMESAFASFLKGDAYELLSSERIVRGTA